MNHIPCQIAMVTFFSRSISIQFVIVYLVLLEIICRLFSLNVGFGVWNVLKNKFWNKTKMSYRKWSPCIGKQNWQVLRVTSIFSINSSSSLYFDFWHTHNYFQNKLLMPTYSKLFNSSFLIKKTGLHFNQMKLVHFHVCQEIHSRMALG